MKNLNLKNILVVFLSVITFSLFAQTEPANEMRTSTSVLKSITGTNFHKSVKTIGGKLVTVYEQPNTNTYNTFSLVNDSLRIQNWKLDTASNTFVTVPGDDIYLDNLVNGAPNTDTRLELSAVNDSLKIDVLDVLSSTVLSTTYIDNVINPQEHIWKKEQLVITTDNVIPDLSFLPLDSSISLFFDGFELTENLHYTISGQTFTFSPSALGKDIIAGSLVNVIYQTK